VILNSLSDNEIRAAAGFGCQVPRPVGARGGAPCGFDATGVAGAVVILIGISSAAARLPFAFQAADERVAAEDGVENITLFGVDQHPKSVLTEIAVPRRQLR